MLGCLTSERNMAHTSPDHKLSLLIALVLTLGIALGIGWWSSSTTSTKVTEASLGVPPLNVSVKRLSEERQRAEAPDPKGRDAILMAQVREINKLQFGTPSVEEGETAAFLLMDAVNELALVQGSYRHILATVNPIIHACQNAFEPVRSALKSGNVTYEVIISDPPETFAAYRSDCGNVLPVLVKLGLINESGDWLDPTNGPAIFSILNRLRLAGLSQDRIPVSELLTAYEVESLYHWRMLNPALTVQEKERFARSAERELKGFLADEWLGRVYYSAGNIREARDAYLSACEKRKNDQDLAARCRLIKKLAESAEPATAKK